MRDPMYTRHRLESELDLQPLLPLVCQTDEERQWAEQKRGIFRQALPISAVELAKRVAYQPERSVAELADELKKPKDYSV